MSRSILLLICSAVALLAGPRDDQWKKVQEAINKGLPKTAIAGIGPIVQDAMEQKAYGEAVRAISLRIALEANSQGNKPEEKITRMEAEVAKAPEALKPVMEAILANWYWHYFQQNRWRFLERTQTAEAPGGDFTTWDLPRILAEIDGHFTRALSCGKQLKATPVAAFDDLLEKGTVPDTYRPTLYDVLAHDALAFYCAGEQGALKAEDAFEIAADSPVFSSADAFLAWKPASDEAGSPIYKALRLHQELLAFHRGDRDRTAFADVDLLRLRFGYENAVGDDRKALYKAALKRFVGEWSSHEVAGRALAAWASVLQGEQAFAEAHELAARGHRDFPETAGGSLCFNILSEIESRSSSLQTERVWNDPLPTLDITYRNVTRVHFRVVAVDFESMLTSQRWGSPGYRPDLDPALIEGPPALAWSVDLPPTTDFKARTERIPAPKGLKPGFYLVFASHDAAFGHSENQVSVAAFWVSTLALVVRQRRFEDGIDGFILDARTGEPIAGAQVVPWERDREGRLQRSQAVLTDANGMFRIGTVLHPFNPALLLAESRGERVSSDGGVARGDRHRFEEADSRTILFTDRSLYRPGQTISYKGISFHSDPSKPEYRTLAGQTVTIMLSDPNGNEVERHEHTCNDRGAFSGSFTAPRGRATGRLTISTSSPHGETQINVEEYKRPTFQVELAAPREAARLRGEVTLSGKATAYTGAAIGKAKVRWRVVREVHLPPWCWRGDDDGSGAQRGSQILAHGTLSTESDGTFRIGFTARPDPAIPEKDEPVFHYAVHADVTDAAGETRSDSRTIRIAHTALQASLSADAWQTTRKPVLLDLRTSTYDGEPLAAEGTVAIHALRQPRQAMRGELARPGNRWTVPTGDPSSAATDPSNPESWELGDRVHTQDFRTGPSGGQKIAVTLRAGIYRALMRTRDRFGKPVTSRLTFHVLDPRARRHGIRWPNLFEAQQWSAEAGSTFQALWGTGYEQGRAFVELECRGMLLKSYWTSPGATQELIQHAVDEDMRGGFTVRATFVRENRAYFNERIVDVPWSNKQLSVKWEHFRSRLGPGQKETWTAVVTAPDARKATAEMVAGLYDASLDEYLPHDWLRSFECFRREVQHCDATFQNAPLPFQYIRGGWPRKVKSLDWRYRSFPADIEQMFRGYQSVSIPSIPAGTSQSRLLSVSGTEAVVEIVDTVAVVDRTETKVASNYSNESLSSVPRPAPPSPGPAPAKPDLGKVTARRNLSETAFFFPHLLADPNGRVRMEFTVPESLTEWKFLGFAHDRELRSGMLTGRAVTAKDLMVQPNPPRFVREGDTIEFTVRLSNPSGEKQSGRVKLSFADARTGDSRDAELGNAQDAEKPFDLPARESRSFSWRIAVPDGCEFLTYKAVAATATLSDGEEGFLPVLSRRILVTESLPLPIRGKQEKTFDFSRLLASGGSSTLRHESLTLQMVSRPAWHAVMALPYLMEYPYECSEQVFNRLYANSLARHIAGGNPRIRSVFEQWRATPALDSPLEKNQDLKMVMLEETPWVRQAQAEGQARRNVGLLFDTKRLDGETAATLRKLTEMQLGDGRWPWFPGGRPSDYITLYVVTGFGRLRNAGVDLDLSPARKALNALDTWMNDRYQHIVQKDLHVPQPIEALYLYGRSFYLKDQAIAPQHQEAVGYFLRQARKYWLRVEHRQSQAHLAIALSRFRDHHGLDDTTPEAILRSIKERSVSNEELGMFWRELEHSWWWYRAPIETQAVMIEAFDEVTRDAQAVEDCQVWLLKQKQVQDWKTTTATADAIHALLLGESSKLSSDALVEVTLGGQPIRPEHVEAGTGYYESRFVKGEIKPELGHVTLKKTDEGVSWGSLHWQYLEDMSKLTPHEGTPLRLKKALFVKETTGKGQVLKPLSGPLSVGDELVVRLELRVDRDMEYVHLRDQRGSGTEPVNVLSRYRFQDGLAYYESSRDTASHIFIDYLPKGTYVFEYSVRVQLKGRYQTGLASIQCMYAPEFNGHSESFELEVK